MNSLIKKMIMNYKKLRFAFIAILALTHTPLQSSAREATMTTSTATEQANDEINVKVMSLMKPANQSLES